jgi:hypothetical protein
MRTHPSTAVQVPLGLASIALCTMLLGCNAAKTGHPIVVSSVPAAGATEVDPTLSEIRVTFDQPMRDRSWSWVGGGPSYPETTGEPRYEEGRVAVLPVRLQPDHSYHLNINSERYTNFVSAQGESAPPYALDFTTGPWPEGVERPAAPEPPTVLRTVPAAGATGVGPGLAEIVAEYDQPMSPTSYSWTQRSVEEFPHVRGLPRFSDDTRAVLPVRLEPDTHYWISLNAGEYQGFVSQKGTPATPYLLEFTTGPWPDGVKPPALPEAPTVTLTEPATGATDVDPALTEIRVTFDQPMRDRSWSWVGGGKTYPGGEGVMPHYESDTVCVLPVALEPNKLYRVQVNSAKFTNFRSAEGEPAIPYPIEFRTGPTR